LGFIASDLLRQFSLRHSFAFQDFGNAVDDGGTGKVSFLTGDLAHTFRFTARCAHDSPGKIPPLK